MVMSSALGMLAAPTMMMTGRYAIKPKMRTNFQMYDNTCNVSIAMQMTFY